MQKRIGLLILIFVCIATILMAGCTSQTAAPAAVTTPAPTVTTSLPTTTAPVQTAAPVIVVTTQAPTTVVTTPATSDPILHRWIRKVIMTNPPKAYELKFYPGGTVVYHYGDFKEVSSNMMVMSPYDVEGSGTWTSIGDNKYLVKITPTGSGSNSPTVWEYTYVKADPSKLIAEHIEDQAERDAVPKARQPLPDEMFYPVRAKID